MTQRLPAAGRHAEVNGLQLYYEVHGSGRPLVLLHGALSAIGSSFGKLIPTLAQTHQVIAIDQQAHGRTADIDRPLSVEQMAEDTAALLRQLEISGADFFGYSLGAGVALYVARQHPGLVRRVAVASVTFNDEGFVPGLLEGMKQLQPEMMMGSPWQMEYAEIAPRPQDFATLIAKAKDMSLRYPRWTAEDIQALRMPVLLILGDSDIVRPEHAVEAFRLLGGGIPASGVGQPKARLAILPATTHVGVIDRTEWLLTMLEEFLNAPDGDAA
jgi:pimeloyl-ACP methyl ester carboxylesterase